MLVKYQLWEVKYQLSKVESPILKHIEVRRKWHLFFFSKVWGETFLSEIDGWTNPWKKNMHVKLDNFPR